MLAEDEREAVKEGLPAAGDVADDVLRASGAPPPRRGGFGGGFGGGAGGGAREQDEASEAESVTLLVAVERSLQREALRAAGERLREGQAREGASRAARLSPEEERALGALRPLRGGETLLR